MRLRSRFVSAFYLAPIVLCSVSPCPAENYPIVDTGQERCYDNSLEITYPKGGEPFFGQDAQYRGNQPAYRDNGDGTISDLVTGLMWQKDPGPKKTFPEAVAGASVCRVGGYDDWRLPSIKELYSLIMFSGEDVNPQLTDTSGQKPFINTQYFNFSYGDPAKGERIIDSQMATSTKYVSTTMNGNETMFGVNFADGRIKGYPASANRRGRPSRGYYVFYVRGNPEYGKSKFRDNGDNTITDEATGLTWMKLDSGHLEAGESKDGTLNWEQALEWVEDLEYAGHSDWRLPNIKELQSIIDYSRSPDTTNSAAIDPMFRATPIRDALGDVNYPFYWSSTTHKKAGDGRTACYFAFGRSQGWMQGRSGGGEYRLLDVHGAGSQRSDPKAGDPSRYPRGRGPQGDVIGIYNMVRAVRGGDVEFVEKGPALEERPQQGPRAGGPGGRGPQGGGRGASPSGAGGQRGAGRQRGGPPGQQGGNRQPPGPEGFLNRFDSNKDGQVSKEEFTGPAERFPMLDQDGDGVITRKEMESMPRRGPGQRGGGAGPQGQRGGGRRAGPGGGSGQRGGPSGQQQGGSGPMRSRTDPVEPPKVDRDAQVDTVRSPKPNIIFILADNMGWTGTSVQMDDQVPESKSDYYQTPNLEKLAQEGLRFTQAYAPGSMCTPTRAAILTGRTPAVLHVTTPGGGQLEESRRLLTPRAPLTKIQDAETTIAEALKEVGYATAHLGKWHLGGRGGSHPGEHGFDVHDGATENGGPGQFEDPNPKDIFGITERALDFMTAHARTGTPFYLHLSHYAVHFPMLARESTVTTFDNLPRGRRHGNAAYAAMTFDLDASVGTLLAEIEKLGIADNTYVIFMSDNGAGGGPRSRAENHPLAGGKSQLYEGGIRVPFIARGPGIPAGAACREAITGCDLLPTFCEWAGASFPEDVDGTSLVPLLTGRPDSFGRKKPSLLFHYPHYGPGPAVPHSALLVGNYKVVRDYESLSVQLFDLAADLSESNNLANAMPDKAKELDELLADRLKRADAQMPSLNPDYDPNAAVPRGRASGGRAGAKRRPPRQ